MKTRIIALILILCVGAAPALAQNGATHTITFDGFRFSFDASIADNVNLVRDPGTPASLAPGAAEVRHQQFLLYKGSPAPESAFDAAGAVRVYTIADFKGYTEHEKRLQQLQSLLAKHPDLTPYVATAHNLSENNLPYLPVLAAGQALRAHLHYVETAAVKGIGFITIYQEAAEPLLSDSLMYTFQGISADGQYYISATFKLTTGLFPEKPGADFDPEAFVSKLGEYLAKSTALVDRAKPNEFKPDLTTLDATVQSIAFVN